jgi:hypothetical protein
VSSVLKPKPCWEAKLKRDNKRRGYLVEHDVGVDDEDGGRVGAELAFSGDVAGGAGDGAAVYAVAEVVLADDLRGGAARVR